METNVDSIYEEAKALVIKEQLASPSYLQRKLKIGYMRARRLVDQMEADNIVGPERGTRPRKVLVKQVGGESTLRDELADFLLYTMHDQNSKPNKIYCRLVADKYLENKAFPKDHKIIVN